MKLFEEHNSDYALRVGVNRSATSYYHYTNTYRHLATFLKDKYHLSDMPVKQMDENFIEDFDMYMRTVKRFMPKTILGHVNRLKSVMMLAVFRGIIPFSPFKGYRPQKAGVQADVPYGRGTGQVCKYDLRYAQPQFHKGHVPVLVLDGHLLLRHEGVDGEEPCKSRGRKPVDSYRTAEDRNARMCKADGDTARHLGEIQGHGCKRETAAHAYEREHEPPPQKDVGDVRHQPSGFIPSGTSYIRQHNMSFTRHTHRNGKQNHGAQAYKDHTTVRESHARQD